MTCHSLAYHPSLNAPPHRKLYFGWTPFPPQFLSFFRRIKLASSLGSGQPGDILVLQLDGKVVGLDAESYPL